MNIRKVLRWVNRIQEGFVKATNKGIDQVYFRPFPTILISFEEKVQFEASLPTYFEWAYIFRYSGVFCRFKGTGATAAGY